MFALALLCLSLAACGAKQYPMQITVVNRSTYPIADIRISLNPEEGWGENRLETTLEEGDGRGDVIPQDGIPVLMGGALPFTNMQNLLSENHDDGTYRYEDITEDGQLLFVPIFTASARPPMLRRIWVRPIKIFFRSCI